MMFVTVYVISVMMFVSSSIHQCNVCECSSIHQSVIVMMFVSVAVYVVSVMFVSVAVYIISVMFVSISSV